MAAGWLVYLLLTGTLVALACVAADALARSHRMPTRWIWAAGFVALALLSARALLTAREGGVVLPTTARVGALDSAAPAASSRTIASAAGWLLASVSAGLGDAIARVARMLPAWLDRGAAVLWLALSVAALLAIALVHGRIARSRRRWPAARLHGHDVHIAPTVGPAVLGVVRPFIVVPRWLLGRGDEEQRLVLAHESEHVRAGDHLLLTGAWIGVALLPWHPAAWWMLSRLRLAIELDCDARVLSRGVAARVYGTLLIDLAGQCSTSTVGATALADESSHLERRLLAMKPTASRFTHLRAGALLAGGALALLAACEAKVPTATEIQGMDVASAERSMTAAKMLESTHLDSMSFFVDGRQVDARTAHAYSANQIATVRVSKEKRGAAVHITTTGASRAADAAGHEAPGGLMALHRALARSLHGSAGDTSHAVMLRTPSTSTAMYIVDGVKVDAAAVERINPADILEVEVLKGAEATRRYSDPMAANGVVVVRTRAR